MSVEQIDYRVKAAQEGRAVYIPGKSADQVRAGMQGSAEDADTLSIVMTSKEMRALELATADVPYLIHSAQQVFELLHSGFAGGWLRGEELCGLLELCGRGMRSVAEVECETLGMLDGKVRKVLAEQAEAQRQAELRRA